jgi:hypothetical protein
MNKQKRIERLYTILRTIALTSLFTFLLSATTVFADIDTSFDESTLPTNLFLDVPNVNVGTITLQTNTQSLFFSGPGADVWWYRNGLPFAWTPVPSVGIGGSWEAETEIEYLDTLAYSRLAGMTLYSGPDGYGGSSYGQEFTFSLDHWDNPKGVWVQGLGDNRPGDSGNLSSALTTDKVTLRMVVTRGVKNYNTYNFYYRLMTNDAWTSIGTIHHTGAFTRAALFFKGTQMNVTFNHFRLTTLDAGTSYAYATNSDNTLTLTEYAGSANSVIIPDQINEQSVTAIGDSAFNGCTSLTDVVIPESVTSIGNYAFNNCTSLTNVTIPEGITTINNGVFTYCAALSSITLPNSLTSIGDYAFNGCTSLTNVVIPEGVTTISNGAFSSCSALPSVTLPNSLTSIGDSVFNSCTSLTNMVIPESVISIGNAVFSYCTSLSEAPISSNMTAIGSYMFSGCTGLRTVTIPEGVTSIGDNAFDGCSDLTNIVFPDSVTSLGSYAFNNCSSLTMITIPKNLTSIGYCPLSGTGLTNVVFPDNMTAIAPGMFAGCTGLGTMTIPRGITVIGDGAFSSCYNLTNVVFPDTLTTIGYNAFEGCALTRISIPSSVTTINDYAFYYCTSLTSVTLPGSVTYLPSETFGYCFSLTAVYFQGDAPGMSWDTFDSAWGAVFYYLPETAGWADASANTGLSAQLWNPTIQAGAQGFGPIASGYYFNISGTPNIPIQVEACTNLAEECWTPLLTAPLSNGSLDFTDESFHLFPVRFYRIVGP